MLDSSPDNIAHTSRPNVRRTDREHIHIHSNPMDMLPSSNGAVDDLGSRYI